MINSTEWPFLMVEVNPRNLHGICKKLSYRNQEHPGKEWVMHSAFLATRSISWCSDADFGEWFEGYKLCEMRCSREESQSGATLKTRMCIAQFFAHPLLQSITWGHTLLTEEGDSHLKKKESKQNISHLRLFIITRTTPKCYMIPKEELFLLLLSQPKNWKERYQSKSSLGGAGHLTVTNQTSLPHLLQLHRQR